MGARWIKLDVGILKDIKIMKIRRMKNGDAYFACWIGLICHAMEHGSDAIEVAEGVSASASDVALICGVTEEIAGQALQVFSDFKMISYSDSGEIRISKFNEQQSIEQYNLQREQAAERQRRRRERLAGQKSGPLSGRKAKPKKTEQEIQHTEYTEIEHEWDEAYLKETNRKYVRTQKALFRDRALLAPLIKAQGADVVKSRIRAYFCQPPQYNLRTIQKFCERYNGIADPSPPPADYSDWDSIGKEGDT